jgi:hypothetical protein
MHACIRRFVSWIALCVAALASGGLAAAADEGLDSRLLQEAPGILKFCRDKGFKNVGILKFQIKKGDKPASHSAGTLTVDLPRRLETALLLKDDPKQPLGIIHNASAVAAKIPGATHLTAEGRQKLFSAQYTLAWKSPPVSADAFLVGVVKLSEDRRSMKVFVWSIVPSGAEPEQVTKFDVTPDGGDLAETGESFVVRGIFSGGKVEMTQVASADSSSKSSTPPSPEAAADSASKVKQGSSASDHPASPSNADAPVELEVRYDNTKIPFEIKDGQAFLVEPQDNQKVTFILKRKAQDSVRYGVVLKVNGENTLERQRLKDINCRKWILEPNSQPLVISGFQMADDSAQSFRVLSRADSKNREVDYGDNVGTITMVVFRDTGASSEVAKTPAAPGGAPAPPSAPAAPSNSSAPASSSVATSNTPPAGAPAPPSAGGPAPGETRTAARDTKKSDTDDEDFTTLTRGVFPKTTPPNRGALIAQLGSSVKGEKTRGLIVEGERVGSRTSRVPFTADPNPMMSVTLIYYPR